MIQNFWMFLTSSSVHRRRLSIKAVGSEKLRLHKRGRIKELDELDITSRFAFALSYDRILMSLFGEIRM
ncbi:MAG TPA: hypothetical protein VNJ08_12990 [Bacteriovoracaceae bacterium]|nr:hypothetical protein [Bacteriovoracaceae bacterium]